MDTSNKYSTLSPIYKASYERIKQMFKKKHEPEIKARSMDEASKDPEAFMEKMKNANIKHVKGIAF